MKPTQIKIGNPLTILDNQILEKPKRRIESAFVVIQFLNSIYLLEEQTNRKT